jgi:hypothetical protein
VPRDGTSRSTRRRGGRLAPPKRRHLEEFDAGRPQHLEETRNCARHRKRARTGDVHILGGVRHGPHAERIQQCAVRVRTDQEGTGFEQAMIVQHRQREEGLSIDRRKPGARK